MEVVIPSFKKKGGGAKGNKLGVLSVLYKMNGSRILLPNINRYCFTEMLSFCQIFKLTLQLLVGKKTKLFPFPVFLLPS